MWLWPRVSLLALPTQLLRQVVTILPWLKSHNLHNNWWASGHFFFKFHLILFQPSFQLDCFWEATNRKCQHLTSLNTCAWNLTTAWSTMHISCMPYFNQHWFGLHAGTSESLFLPQPYQAVHLCFEYKTKNVTAEFCITMFASCFSLLT